VPENVKLALLVLIAVILVGMTLIVGFTRVEKRSRNEFSVDTKTRSKFSDVYVLIDATESMSDADVLSAKEIVSKRILSSLGMNDTAYCFALGGSFHDSESTVFGISNDQPPNLADNDAQKILDLVKAEGDLRQRQVYDEDTFKLIEQVKALQPEANAKRDDWQKKVEALERPTTDGSDYVAALEGINRSMTYKKQPGRDNWLIVVGDLKNESRTHPPAQADGTAFKNFNHILLVYPFNSNDPKWPATEKFWGTYFGDIKHEKHTFVKARNEFLIGPNPTSGFETKRGEDSILVFLPFGIGALIICLTAVFLFRGIRKPTRDSK
jgi:hypothetical protein